MKNAISIALILPLLLALFSAVGLGFYYDPKAMLETLGLVFTISILVFSFAIGVDMLERDK